MSSPASNATIDVPPPAENWGSEDEFEARLKRIQSQAATPKPAEGENAAGDAPPDAAALLAENTKLKASVEEGRRRVSQLELEIEKCRKREEDQDKLLEEKSEVVRTLEQELAGFKSKQSSGVTEEELLALHAELEKERQHLEEDRATMEQQFRQLEMNMSRERAEIARERNELQRTKTELKHKLEAIEKGSGQQDLSPLRRLRDEVAPQAPAPMARPAPPTLPALQNLPALNRKAPESEDTKRSGIISRFLGKRE